jgi:Protein of unknown function (DUF2783)
MMKPLNTAPNLAQADRIYTAFLELHEGRTDAQSHAINARLVFALSNHIGDERVIQEAFALAGAAT